LRDIISRIERVYFRDDQGKWKYPEDPKLTVGYYARGLRSALQSFEAVFRAEMQAASTYLVPKRGAHSTRDLVDTFDRTFLPGLHPTLGELALNEYRQAGRCFAFGLWTAAGLPFLPRGGSYTAELLSKAHRKRSHRREDVGHDN
jgi:hypothetical protein